MPKAQKPTSVVDRYLKILKLNRPQAIAIVVGLSLVLLLVFPFRFLVVPAIVNGQPIFSWQYLTKLHQQAGQQVLDQIINEAIIKQEIQKQGVQVTQTEIDQQVQQIEAQVGQLSGGLDAMLAAQGLTRNQFIDQIRLNLSLEKLVKGNIVISDEQINQELTDNAAKYTGLSDLDAATTAAENLRTAKLQETFTTWFQELKDKANIKNFFKTQSL